MEARPQPDGLKSPVPGVRLPLVVTSVGELVVRGAQVNRFTVTGPFVGPLSSEPGRLSGRLIRFLSERYMTHLLGAGRDPCSSLPIHGDSTSPRRPYLAGLG